MAIHKAVVILRRTSLLSCPFQVSPASKDYTPRIFKVYSLVWAKSGQGLHAHAAGGLIKLSTPAGIEMINES
jgi:hypothetical protein